MTGEGKPHLDDFAFDRAKEFAPSQGFYAGHDPKLPLESIAFCAEGMLPGHERRMEVVGDYLTNAAEARLSSLCYEAPEGLAVADILPATPGVGLWLVGVAEKLSKSSQVAHKAPIVVAHVSALYARLWDKELVGSEELDDLFDNWMSTVNLQSKIDSDGAKQSVRAIVPRLLEMEDVERRRATTHFSIPNRDIDKWRLIELVDDPEDELHEQLYDSVDDPIIRNVVDDYVNSRTAMALVSSGKQQAAFELVHETGATRRFTMDYMDSASARLKTGEQEAAVGMFADFRLAFPRAIESNRAMGLDMVPDMLPLLVISGEDELLASMIGLTITGEPTGGSIASNLSYAAGEWFARREAATDHIVRYDFFRAFLVKLPKELRAQFGEGFHAGLTALTAQSAEA